MATLPSFRTWVSGEVVVAAYMNTDIRDAGNFWLARPLCILRQTSVQSLTNATFTDILFDTEDIDRDGGHSTVSNTARYTSPTAGYLMNAGGPSFAFNATGVRIGAWALNGTLINGTQVEAQTVTATNGVCTLANRTSFVPVNGSTDYVTMQALQGSGGALNTSVTTVAQSRWDILWISTS